MRKLLGLQERQHGRAAPPGPELDTVAAFVEGDVVRNVLERKKSAAFWSISSIHNCALFATNCSLCAVV